MHSYWHVIWTTFLAWSPSDLRGDWEDLGKLYRRLAEDGYELSFSHNLPGHWQRKPAPETRVELKCSEARVVRDELLNLTSSGGDRVAGNLEVLSVSVGATEVHLLVKCREHDLHQKISRLKSRVATLLSFSTEGAQGGAKTWAKGVWKARIHDERAVERIQEFISAQGAT